MDRQTTFADIEDSSRRRSAKREAFLEAMDAAIPRGELVAAAEPFRYPVKRGRRPIGAGRMLRMCFLQLRFGLSDEGAEDAVCDSRAFSRFMGVGFGPGDRAPDAATLPRFRRIIERNGTMPGPAREAPVGTPGGGRGRARGPAAARRSRKIGGRALREGEASVNQRFPKSVSLSQKFSFTGRGITRLCKLPKPLEKKGYTGLWVSSTDGMAYAPDEIPNYVAATYTAQIAFPDVDYSDWYGNAVSFVSAKGLITGYTDGEKAGFFGVGDTLTRAQFATILWRNACPDEYAAYDPKTAMDTTGIEGSADGMYYTAAANWAVANGYITGIDNLDGTFDFAADKPVSFEQMITILARITATPDEVAASRGDLTTFVDGDMASSWSRDSLAWAHDLGLVEGYNDPDRGKLLCPGENVERQRAATVLARAFTMGVLK